MKNAKFYVIAAIIIALIIGVIIFLLRGYVIAPKSSIATSARLIRERDSLAVLEATWKAIANNVKRDTVRDTVPGKPYPIYIHDSVKPKPVNPPKDTTVYPWDCFIVQQWGDTVKNDSVGFGYYYFETWYNQPMNAHFVFESRLKPCPKVELPSPAKVRWEYTLEASYNDKLKAGFGAEAVSPSGFGGGYQYYPIPNTHEGKILYRFRR